MSTTTTYEVQIFDGGFEVGTFDLSAIPSEGELFEDGGYTMRAVRVELEPDSGSDARVEIEYVCED